MATLRSLAINALRLDGFWSITEGLAAVAHDIKGLLEPLGCLEARQPQGSGSLLMSPAACAASPWWRQWPAKASTAACRLKWQRPLPSPNSHPAQPQP